LPVCFEKPACQNEASSFFSALSITNLAVPRIGGYPVLTNCDRASAGGWPMRRALSVPKFSCPGGTAGQATGDFGCRWHIETAGW
jgi:hypothetical protein